MTTQNLAGLMANYEVRKLIDGQVVDVSGAGKSRIIPCWMMFCKEVDDFGDDLKNDDEYVVFPLLPDGIKASAAKLIQDSKEHSLRFDEVAYYHEAYRLEIPVTTLLEALPHFDYAKQMQQVRDIILKTASDAFCISEPLLYNQNRFLYVAKSRYDTMMILDFDDNAYRPQVKVVKDLGVRKEIAYTDTQQLLKDCFTMSESAVNDMFVGLDQSYVDYLNRGWCDYPGVSQRGSWQLYHSIRLVDIVPTIVSIGGKIQHVGYDFAGALSDTGRLVSYADLGEFRSVYATSKKEPGVFSLRHTLQILR